MSALRKKATKSIQHIKKREGGRVMELNKTKTIMDVRRTYVMTILGVGVLALFVAGIISTILFIVFRFLCVLSRFSS